MPLSSFNLTRFSRPIARCLELGLGKVAAESKDADSDYETKQRVDKEVEEKEDDDSDYESDQKPETVRSIVTL